MRDTTTTIVRRGTRALSSSTPRYDNAHGNSGRESPRCAPRQCSRTNSTPGGGGADSVPIPVLEFAPAQQGTRLPRCLGKCAGHVSWSSRERNSGTLGTISPLDFKQLPVYIHQSFVPFSSPKTGKCGNHVSFRVPRDQSGNSPEREFLLFDGPGGAMGIGFLFWRRCFSFFSRVSAKIFWFFFGCCVFGGVFALFGGDFAF